MNLVALIVMVMVQATPAAPAAPAAPATPPGPPAAPSAPPAPPSLDDALGIEGAEPGDAPPADLDAALAGAPPKDILESAIADMRRSARMLDERKAGLPTRRIQESVVRKLDELIATAQRMQQQQQQQQQQQGQSASQQQRQGQRQQQGQQRGDGRQQGEDAPRPDDGDASRRRRDGAEGEQRGRRDGAAREADASQPPGAVDPTDVAAQFDESRVEWGQLPPRVRDAVRQGVRDPMSAAYRRLTQEYYRRLAEEGRK